MHTIATIATEPVFTIAEISALLKVDRRTVHRWVKLRRLRGRQTGKIIRVNESDYQAFLRTWKLA